MPTASMPPGMDRASKIVGRKPFKARKYPAVKPAGPAPMMAIFSRVWLTRSGT
jgi:hypothetical protein